MRVCFLANKPSISTLFVVLSYFLEEDCSLVLLDPSKDAALTDIFFADCDLTLVLSPILLCDIDGRSAVPCGNESTGITASVSLFILVLLPRIYLSL